MNNKPATIILSVSLIVLSSLTFPENCTAAFFSLSASPYEGGYNLNFDKITPASGHVNKEVTITVNSDIAKQYRITQTLFEPLSSMRGASLPSNGFLVYGLRGSNRSGTLTEQSIPVSMGRQVIYTSDTQGSPDSFTLVFDLAIPGDIESGSYRGRIGFSLEAINSTQPPATAFLNVFAEVEVESSIKINNINGSKNIRLRAGKDYGPEDVVVNISGGFGNQFRILQFIEEQPVSLDGTVLDWDVVKFNGSEAKKGMLINESSPLSGRQQIVYTSSPSGEADKFVLTYSLGDTSTQKAGTYRSKVKFILEGIGFSAERLLEILNLEIDIPQVFDLAVMPELGGIISFRDLRPQQPPRVQEVTFEVKTNMGKRYQVTQNMNSLLTSKEGQVIAKENFTLKEESLDSKGILKYLNKSEIREGQMVLFTSDLQGSPDKFKVIYELSAPVDVHSGDYYTNFTYSISEI